jgi:hypothetical protein
VPRLQLAIEHFVFARNYSSPTPKTATTPMTKVRW